MRKGTRAPRERLPVWAIIRERGGDVTFYRGPMFPLEGQWVPALADAVCFTLRGEARDTQAGYIDPKIDQTRIVPVWFVLDAARRRAE